MPMDRRRFLAQTSAAAALAPFVDPSHAPYVHVSRAAAPKVIADYSGAAYRNGGAECAVERAFRLMTGGTDILESLVQGVTIPELDPAEMGIGYGALPNADGVVQLDASCMHGPLRRAGAVAGIEGVRTPSVVAKAVADLTDHHLLAGRGAQEFARAIGMEIEADLNTPDSRRLWLEWRRRVDPEHWLDPDRRVETTRPLHERDPGESFARRAGDAAWSMVRDGLIREGSYWGTINCNGINAAGDLAGVTTTSGLAWKINGRIGDSPILGAGLYVDNDVGAAGSTGRGEANLYNLSSYLIVEGMRRGLSPKDAGMEPLARIRDNTVERRLRNARGLPNFNVRFFILNKRGEHAGVAMYAAGETTYAVCTEHGLEEPSFEPLLPGKPADD